MWFSIPNFCQHFEPHANTGAVPSELGRLTHLSSTLDLASNRLTKSLPSQLGQLESLAESLTLQDNLLTAELPSQLGQLKALTKGLDLSTNLFSGAIPSELGKLTALLSEVDLALNPNLCGGVPAQVESLSRLAAQSATYDPREDWVIFPGSTGLGTPCDGEQPAADPSGDGSTTGGGSGDGASGATGDDGASSDSQDNLAEVVGLGGGGGGSGSGSSSASATTALASAAVFLAGAAVLYFVYRAGGRRWGRAKLKVDGMGEDDALSPSNSSGFGMYGCGGGSGGGWAGSQRYGGGSTAGWFGETGKLFGRRDGDGDGEEWPTTLEDLEHELDSVGPAPVIKMPASANAPSSSAASSSSSSKSAFTFGGGGGIGGGGKGGGKKKAKFVQPAKDGESLLDLEEELEDIQIGGGGGAATGDLLGGYGDNSGLI